MIYTSDMSVGISEEDISLKNKRNRVHYVPGIVLGALCMTVLSYFHDIHMKLHYYFRHQKIEKVSEKESNLLTIPQYLSCTPFSKAKFSVLVKSLLLLYYSSSLPITL